MLSLVLSAILAATPAVTVAPRDQAAVDRCRARFAARIGPDGDFSVTRLVHGRRGVIISGSLTQMEREPPATPGMMRPNHVRADSAIFRCEFRGRRLIRARLAAP